MVIKSLTMGLQPTLAERVREALGTYAVCEARGAPLSAPAPLDSRVTVVVPTYRSDKKLLRRAVQSILDQTHQNLRCVVISDGDEDAPFEALPDDPRVVTFTLERNRGQFFATDVVLRATPDPYLIIQDDDDVSDKHRIAKLMKVATDHNTDYVLTDIEKIPPGKKRGQGYLLQCHIDPALSLNNQVMYHLGPHMGLFKTEALRLVGGYVSDIRLGYDTYVVALMGRFGRIAYLPETLYYQYQHPGSMTMKKATSMRSKKRRAATQVLANRWVRIQNAHTCPFAMARNINRIARQDLEPHLVAESNRLRELLT